MPQIVPQIVPHALIESVKTAGFSGFRNAVKNWSGILSPRPISCFGFEWIDSQRWSLAGLRETHSGVQATVASRQNLVIGRQFVQSGEGFAKLSQGDSDLMLSSTPEIPMQKQ